MAFSPIDSLGVEVSIEPIVLLAKNAKEISFSQTMA